MRTSLTPAEVLELREWLLTGRATEIREGAGLSRSALARDIGVAESALFRWEHGSRRPTGLYAAAYHRTLARLARSAAYQAALPARAVSQGGGDAA